MYYAVGGGILSIILAVTTSLVTAYFFAKTIFTMANSGKTYVSSISKFKPLPSPEMKQANMLLKAYSNYCINSKETNRDFTEI